MKAESLDQSYSLSRPPKVLMGAASILFGLFLYTTVNAALKTCQQEYHMAEILFFRFGGSLLPCFLLMRREGGFQAFRTKNFLVHAIRGIFGVISLGCLFQSIFLLPFSDAITLSFAITLFTVALSPVWLKEVIAGKVWLAVIFGFIGVSIMARPTGDVWSIGIVFALISAFLEACFMLHNRVFTRTETTTAMVFYSCLVSCLICAMALPFYWVTPTPYDWCVLLTLGIGGGVGHFFVMNAARFAPASFLGPMVYSMMIWSTLYSVFLFHEPLTLSLLVGGGLVVLSGLYVVFHPNKAQST